MSKLNASDKFLDLSDYGRSFGRFLALQLKETRFTPIHVTLLFGISGLIAIYCILNHYFHMTFQTVLMIMAHAYLNLYQYVFLNKVSGNHILKTGQFLLIVAQTFQEE